MYMTGSKITMRLTHYQVSGGEVAGRKRTDAVDESVNSVFDVLLEVQQIFLSTEFSQSVYQGVFCIVIITIGSWPAVRPFRVKPP